MRSPNKSILHSYLTIALLVILTLNLIYWHSPYLGLPVIIILGYIVTQSLRIILRLRAMGEAIVAFMVLFAAVTLINLFSVYFFSFHRIVAIGSLWLISISVLVLAKSKSPKNELTSQPIIYESPALNRFGFLAFPVGLICSFIYIAKQINIQQTQQIYNGFLPASLQINPILLFIIFVATGVVILSRIRVKYVWISLLMMYLATTGIFALGLKTLYGADSWRHLSIEKYIAQEHVYQPTSLSSLLTFSSEKIPNSTQYTVVAVFQQLTQIDLQILHKYLAWAFFGPIAVLLIFSIALLFTSSKRTSFFVTLFSFTSYGIIYTGQITYPQALGLLLMLATILVWSRYAIGRDIRVGIPQLVITGLAILTYPTTALISLLIAIAAYTSRHFRKKIPIFLAILVIILFAIVIAFPFPVLDIVFKKIPIAQQFQESSLQAMHLFQTQVKNLSLNAINSLLVIPTLAGVIGAIWLLKKRHLRSFGIILLAFVFGLQLVQFFNAYAATGIYFVFSGRVALMLSVLATFFLGVGLVLILRKSQWQKLTTYGLLVIFGLIFMQKNNLESLNFGYSISTREISIIKTIEKREQNRSYIVLCDEVTSAAGNAITGFSAGHYYWYPGGGISDAYWNIIGEPSKSKLRSICTNFKVSQVFLITTPIPPNERYQKNIEQLVTNMRKIDQQGESKAYEFTCGLDESI